MIEVHCHRMVQSYPVIIETGLLAKLSELLSALIPASKGVKVLLVTNPEIWTLYGETIDQAVKQGIPESFFETIEIPAGESSKNLTQAQRIYDQLFAMGASRKDVLIAFGGGVIGDLTGYCAATYYRGMRFVQIPTTLLAQVDSSVGGKVAVNYHAFKNCIGAFYQPEAVWIDPDVLKTLPVSERAAGLAEVIKYALIEQNCDASTSGFFDQLCSHQALLLKDTFPLDKIIEHSCHLKASIVAQDEQEITGLRALLNLGHTLAHALESLTRYHVYLHGEAVAVGMVFACKLAEAIGQWPTEQTARLEQLLQAVALPIRPKPSQYDYSIDEVMDLMRQDKKASHGRITFILPVHQMGLAQLRQDIPESQVAETLTQFLSSP